MALKGLDIFKLSPKKNCKECGCPTCMAFCMKVAQGALPLDKCPYMSDEAVALLSEQTAPPMKTITVGDYKFGGETVMFRHDKTFVSRPLFAQYVCDGQPVELQEKELASVPVVDYERIGERMYVEFVNVNHYPEASEEEYLALVEKSKAVGRAMIIACEIPEIAEKALAAIKGVPAILTGADASNYEAMNKVATAAGVPLGVRGANLDEIHDTVAALEALGNKNLFINVDDHNIKEAFAQAVRIRRAALKNSDRTFGYPSIIHVQRMTMGMENAKYMAAALASLFTCRYGSIIIMDEMDYAKALPLYGLRQNIFTDPQKPMKVEPGIYPLNGAGPDAICATTVDFALTYFVVSGEIERSKVPVNLLISDAGGYSVLTAWAAGKLSAGSIAKFIEEQAIESKVTSRTLLLPGKVAVLKGELEAKLPNWKILVAPTEAVQLVKFLRDMQENGEA